MSKRTVHCHSCQTEVFSSFMGKGLVLSSKQVEEAFPRAWRAIPKTYRDQDNCFTFFLTLEGRLESYFDYPDDEIHSRWDRKKREWTKV